MLRSKTAQAGCNNTVNRTIFSGLSIFGLLFTFNPIFHAVNLCSCHSSIEHPNNSSFRKLRTAVRKM